ncbi:MAG TPA: hypothetical protein VNE40_02030 [Candidatus Dormibacteraeota bacterium]|nr:hypothetical protein [Candidatus Dormibacteraeota bacterium]
MNKVQGVADTPEQSWQFKPGDIITPSSSKEQSSTIHSQLAEPEQPPSPPISTKAEDLLPTSSTAATETSKDDSITWTASEFVAHHKSTSWYLVLAVAALGLAAIVWLLTKDKISTGVVLVGAVVFGGYGARQPRQLSYSLNGDGLTVGDKRYSLDEFRSFSVIAEGAFSSITFMPLKRFGSLTTIYYDPADEARIIDLLAERLPSEEPHHDMVDRFMGRIRF